MAEVKLASYLRKRASVLNMMKALEAFCESYDSKEIDEVPIRLELIEQCKVDYKDIMSKIEELDLENPEESINYVQENAEFFTRFCKVKGFLLVQTKQDSSVMNTTLFGSTMCVGKDVSPHLRLPKVDLPTFNGDSTSWLSFRDRFTSMIHSSSDIPPVLKLQYLLSSLKGEAASHFEHTNITADNYAITWNALLKQYDDERMLIREYYRALHFLPSMKSESVDELSQLVDDFVRHVKGLERLKEPIAKWDTPLTNMLFFKLDDATLLAWETYSASNSRDTYGVLIEFLQERIKILKSRIRHGETAGCSKVAGVSNKPKLCGFRSKFVRGGGFAAACTQQGVKRCSACEEQHELYQCASFEKMSVRDRSNLVSKFKLCFNCLKPNHTSRLCASRFKCRHCGKAHHTLLCFNAEKPTKQGPVATVTTVENEEQPIELPLSQVNHTQCATKTVFLSTAVVYVLDKNGVKLPARALIDSGAQINLITERLVQQLRLPRNAVHVPISGVGNTASNVKSKVTTKIKSSRSSYECVLDFLVLSKLVPRLPSVTVDTQSWNIPCNIQLADPQFNVASDVDIILGAEVFFNLIIGGQISLASNMPLLVNSHLGWIVSGTYTSGNLVPSPICASTCYAEEKTLSEIMQAFFRIEEVQDDRKWSGEELECEEHFMKTTTRDEHGRYIVRLPCKDNMQLGDSRQNALRRFNSLEKRFIREPNIKMDYVEFMEEYIRLGHMTLVKESEPNDEREFYLPHHPVFKLDSTTTKCRVVFDASCKSSNGVSLNDILKVGPTIQQDSTSIIMRWRTKRVAIIADVAKMFRQVWVHEDDRPLQKILWRANTSVPVQTYELNTVTYGTGTASFLAIRALQQTLHDHGEEYPLAASRKNDFYVDDFVSGANTIEEAKRLCAEAKSLFSKGGFELRKWASNEPGVLPVCNSNEREVPLLCGSENNTLLTLGLVWDPASDTIGIKVPSVDVNAACTRRSVLGVTAKIYDPDGIIETVKAKAKQFMQNLWRLKTEDEKPFDWDDEIPEPMRSEWVKFLSQLGCLRHVKVPRLVTATDPINIQIHGFCDASEIGYGACVYFRSTSRDETVISRLFASKSKVVPLSSKHSIAKLELCAAHLLSKLMKKIVDACELSNTSTYCWTDSTTVLHWLKGSPSRWKTFVGNRVSEIQGLTKDFEWRHVPGVQNPADAVSRGRYPDEVKNDVMWWQGPNWLVLSKEVWPATVKNDTYDSAEAMQEAKLVLTLVKDNEEESLVDLVIERCGSFSKLKRVIGHCCRFVDGLRKRAKPEALRVWHLRKAETIIIRQVQREAFGDEVEKLAKNVAIRKSSPLRWLSPVLDEDNIIRVGGRLSNAALRRSARHPVVVPGKHRLASMIAEHYHKIMLHSGMRLTSSSINQSYWILGGRRVVKNAIHNCVRCTRCRPKMVQQPMGDLPASRVKQARPFEVTGVDYAGPILIKGTHRRPTTVKAYVSIFVCFVTKATHIELVSDLTTFAFLAALRRFVARRGLVAEMHSDNGTNFRGAFNHLNELTDLLRNETHREDTIAWCYERGIKWSFSPPASPHFGGLWEAAVKSMKHHLTRVVGNVQMTFENMATLLAEVEACLNSRPLTQLSEDPNDLEALTPGHFLVGCNLQTLPDVRLDDINVNKLNHWRQVQSHMQHIWRRWHIEYLQELQKRSKWDKSKTEIVPGMLVVVQEENTHVSRWPLARIQEIHPGKDGIVRVVTLNFGSGRTGRKAVAKIAILPVEGV